MIQWFMNRRQKKIDTLKIDIIDLIRKFNERIESINPKNLGKVSELDNYNDHNYTITKHSSINEIKIRIEHNINLSKMIILRKIDRTIYNGKVQTPFIEFEDGKSIMNNSIYQKVVNMNQDKITFINLNYRDYKRIRDYMVDYIDGHIDAIDILEYNLVNKKSK